MKTMLITGASGGIGKGLVDYYQGQYDVKGCSRGLQTDYQCDVADPVAVEMLAEMGRVDVLINNAGIASMNSFLLTSYPKMEHVVQTNLLGTMLMCQKVGKMMMRQKWGRIVNVSSVAVPLALEGEAVYAASKAAVETLTRVLAKEFAPFNVTVNCVAPSPVDTRLIEGVGEERIGKVLDKLAVKRMCTVDDIANVVDFFISEKSGMTTGQTIYLGGA